MKKLLNRVILLKVFGVLILFQTMLFSDNIYYVSKSDVASVSSQVVNSTTKESEKVTTVALDSFGGTSIVLMIVFTSLLGAFFVRDEFGSIMD